MDIVTSSSFTPTANQDPTLAVPRSRAEIAREGDGAPTLERLGTSRRFWASDSTTIEAEDTSDAHARYCAYQMAAHSATIIQQRYRKYSLSKFGKQSAVWVRMRRASLWSLVSWRLRVAMIIPVLMELSFFGFSISWRDEGIAPGLGSSMVDYLQYGSLVTSILFGIRSLVVKLHSFKLILDFVVSVISLLAWGLWTRTDAFSPARMNIYQLVAFLVLTTYRALTMLGHALQGAAATRRQMGLATAEHIATNKLICVTRGTGLILQLWEELDSMHRNILAHMGPQYGREAFQIRVYVTRASTEARKELVEAVKGITHAKKGK
eukprot:scaffold2140_cov394-Prasinococcus_capsulatus_cf.AAC.8